MRSAVKSLKNLVFFVPENHMVIGGLEMLVINLATEISSQDGESQVLVICSKQSFVAEQLGHLAGNRLRLSFWSENIPEIHPESLLVCWGGYGTLARLRHSNPRLLVWCIMQGAPFAHFERVPRAFNWLKPRLKKSCRQTLRFLSEHDGIAFMDKPNHLDVQQRYGVDVKPVYLPIPVPVGSNAFLQRPINQPSPPPLRISWIGRGGVDLKAVPLVRLLETAHLPEKTLHLTIFTDKPDSYEQLLSGRDVARRVNITFKTGVFGVDLRKQLASDFDINFGMGTAVLEGASQGIPSVCVDPQGDFERLVAWQWLHERQEYDLGHFDAANEFRQPFDFKALDNDRGQLRRLSSAAFDYVSRNHSLKTIAGQLSTSPSSARLHDYLKAHGILFKFVYALKHGFQRLKK